MKWIFFLFVLLLAVLAFKLFPMVMQEKACYDVAGTAIENINFTSTSRELSKSDICSQRSMALLTLEDCVQNATNSSTLAKYTNSFIVGAVSLLRPLTVHVATQINQHNADCIDYPQYQLE